MYRHEAVMGVRAKASRIVTDLFTRFLADPSSMPAEWTNAAQKVEESPRARIVADYVAGMTDRYALSAYRRLFDPHMDLR
jgi:dGTPase